MTWTRIEVGIAVGLDAVYILAALAWFFRPTVRVMLRAWSEHRTERNR